MPAAANTVFGERRCRLCLTVLMEMGLIHPPVGLNLFVINGIAPDIPLRRIVWACCRFSR
jgi:TRAP-type C4-dicarboxylate transport system permease large subunit